MNNDITKCTNEDCVLKEKCLRWTIEADDHQSYAELGAEQKDEDCQYFLCTENH
jgi:hypothetical protein